MKENTYLAFENANISLVAGLSEEISRLEKRIYISHLSESMGRTYCRSLRDLCLYTQSLPDGLELDNEELASKTPYPKEEKTLPTVLSREEVVQLFI